MSAVSLNERNRRVLIVSPSFPPINTPDMQRARMSLPYYREFGWDPVVLTVAAELQESAREKELLATVPRDIKVHRCGALSLKVSRCLGVGNLGLRAWWHLLFAGARLIRREKIDLVFLTNTQFVTFALGRIWRRWLGVPYVIDLQDPWRTDYYERAGARKPPGGWKYQLARLQARFMEPWCFRKLTGFISVSERYIADLRARYSWFRDVPSATIPFGISEHDFAVAREQTTSTTSSSALVRLVYTGAAGPITPHAADLLFRALRSFRDAHPEKAARLRLEFHGTSYAPAAEARPTILPIAEKHGVADLVHETASRVGHLEALRLQAGADGLLLLGSIDPAYSPSKLYPYFLTGRPMLGLALAGSVLENALTELSCSFLVTFEERAANSAAEEKLVEFFSLALEGFPRGALPVRNEALFAQKYLSRALTEEQCRIFSLAAG